IAALAGGAYAASLPRNSVGTKQLKDGAVTPAKVKPRQGSLVRGFAAVNSNGDIISKGGVVKTVTHPSKGVYCFDLRGKVKTAVSSMDAEASAATDASASLPVGTPCVAPNTDAGVFVNLAGVGLSNDIFHVAFLG